MPSYINTNISSQSAQLALTASQSSLSTSLQRLSSGLRINSAADDAAGFAIVNKMSAQIFGLTQAARNANDAISLAQTAGGALNGITNMLQSLRNLAVQASNSTNTASDRAALQQQAASLTAEIQRTATTTQFNGLNLLDGTYTNQSFQVGTAAGQTIAVSIGAATTNALGSSTTASLSATNNGTAMGSGDLVINGTTIGSSLASSDTASTALQSASAIAKAAAINAVSSQTGVTATANANVVAGTAQTLAATTGTLTINGKTTGTITTGGANAAADRASVVAAINAISGQTGVTATDSGTATNGISLTAADGRNITTGFNGTLTASATGLQSLATRTGTTPIWSSGWFVQTHINGTAFNLSTSGNGINDMNTMVGLINAGGTGVTATASANGILLSSNSSFTFDTVGSVGNPNNVGLVGTSAAITVGVNAFVGNYTLSSQNAINVTGSSTIANSGLVAGTYNTQTAAASTTQLAAGAGAAFTAGDFTVNGISVGASLASSDTASTISQAASAIAKAAAINAVSAQTNVTATASTLVQGTAQTAAAQSGTMQINGVTVNVTTTGVASADRTSVVNAINAVSGQTGVSATDSGSSAGGVQLRAADGRNVNVSFGTQTAAATGVTAGVSYGTLTLSSAAQFTVGAGTTGASMATIGMLTMGTYGAGQTGQALSAINLSTAAGASSAIAAIDNAISSVNNTNATLGAIQNRFTQTITTLQSTTQNLTAARSRIQDTDFAAETANMTRAQILQQAATAMLAQSNQLPNTVLALLK